MPFERTCQSVAIPKLDAVSRCKRQSPSVRAEAHGAHIKQAALERAKPLACNSAPQIHCLPAPGRDCGVVRADSDGGDWRGCSFKRVDCIPTLDVPDLDTLVVTAGEEYLPIPAKNNCSDDSQVTFQRSDQDSAFDVPDSDDAIVAGG